MTIYQVINKQNELEYAFLNFEVAKEEVAKLNERTKEDYFFINAIEDEGI
jgi:Ni2+-binding GTPase involved in maturation of urease and hydrogenase